MKNINIILFSLSLILTSVIATDKAELTSAGIEAAVIAVETRVSKVDEGNKISIGTNIAAAIATTIAIGASDSSLIISSQSIRAKH